MTQRAANAGTAWIFNLLLGLFVVLLCLAAGEVVLREWFPLDNVILQPDSRYLYRFIPNSRQLVKPLTASGAPTVLIRINSQGRRGELITKNRKYRVIVYGDSFIASEGTPLGETFVSQFQARLSARLRREISVINAGVPGYGPDQAGIVMEDEIDKIKPRLIVFSVYSGNDFGDLIRNKLFRLDEHGRLAANHPVLDSNVRQAFESASRQQPKVQLIRRIKAVFAMSSHPAASDPYLSHPDQLVKAWVIQSRKEYANYVLDHDNEVHNLFADGYDIDISTDPRSDSALYKKALMERVIEHIHAIAAARSIPLIFLIIPSPIDALDHWDVSIDVQQYPDYQRSALTGAIERVAKADGFHYLNLFATFRSRQSENLFYRGLDDHWNATGQRLAAALLTDYISRNDPLGAALTR